ncbi:hypothetical protein [Methylosinus sp. PW1]|uniref:hypothetical protein n=1 Tax=Methylosinus sp. PW1 TaxID=107636 RepID=UPI00056CD341|nr:hypothetical protein [Methylosinus sp. PW1]
MTPKEEVAAILDLRQRKLGYAAISEATGIPEYAVAQVVRCAAPELAGHPNRRLRREDALRWRDEGIPQAEMARRAGVSTAAVSMCLRRAGVQPRFRAPGREEIERLRELRSQGKSLGVISFETGVPVHRVRYASEGVVVDAVETMWSLREKERIAC